MVKTLFYRRFFASFMAIVVLSCMVVRAQMLLGTRGLVNTPTADMHKTGTFLGGISYVPKELELTRGYYNTGIYYVDFTPFNWMEISFRETLLKTSKMKDGERHVGYYQQDRSTTLRVRPFAENGAIRWRPSVVLGVNDIYSDHGDSRYTAVYAVVTKHVGVSGLGTLGASVGYAQKFNGGVVYNGVFGGIEYCPQGVDNFRLMADWDTSGCNVGAHLQLFRHVNLLVYTREFNCVGASINYQYTIKY